MAKAPAQIAPTIPPSVMEALVAAEAALKQFHGGLEALEKVVAAKADLEKV